MLATLESETPARPTPAVLGLVRYGGLCEMLGITRPTLDRLANGPKEHFPRRVLFGKAHYVRMRDLERWVNERFGG